VFCAARLANSAGFRMSVAMGYHPQGLLASRRGDTDRACATYATLDEAVHQHGIADPCFIPWAGDAIAAYLASGREADARRVIAALEPQTKIFSCPLAGDGGRGRPRCPGRAPG
jgi:hypothetical protein